MNIRFTRHAKNNLRLFDLTQAEVEAILEAPAQTEVGPDKKPNALGTIRDVIYRVVYVVEPKTVQRGEVPGEQVETMTVITLWSEKGIAK